MNEKKDDVLGIIALVCGIASLVLALIIPFVNLGLALVAIICGLIGRSQGQKYSTAGFVLGLVTIIMTIAIIIAGITLYSIFVEEEIQISYANLGLVKFFKFR